MRAALGLAVALALSACIPGPDGEPAVPLFESYRDTSVPIASKALFEPDRYLGLWYEVARFPNVFERGCVNVTAEYGMREDGLISVLNSCGSAEDGSVSTIEGTAEIVGPGRLKVRFASVPFVAGDYWVLWVDEGYRTAVVGNPDGTTGWILNRDPVIPQDRLIAAREILDFNGYDVSRLQMVPQGQ
ncbi:lipocalin family protein [Flavimaricola marinus]|uniref:Outer membrane lipoprotein Blc n=1 Tax=Flavimaricola marinus TaxID=1819565 RepID=A0A238LH82_9RHOB|nr:lipocalin family protein [Flavimaricola marinus]SMY08764.1 Outer membrane lipoprotein Blc precursor [Flavimaricola marinus]